VISVLFMIHRHNSIYRYSMYHQCLCSRVGAPSEWSLGLSIQASTFSHLWRNALASSPPCDHPQRDSDLTSLSSSSLHHSSSFCSFNTLLKPIFTSKSKLSTQHASRRPRPHVQQWRQWPDQQVDERPCRQEDRWFFERDCKIPPSLQAMPRHPACGVWTLLTRTDIRQNRPPQGAPCD